MINYLGIFSIIVFYLLILGVGMWAARKKGGEEMDQEVNYTEILMSKVDFKSTKRHNFLLPSRMRVLF